MEVGWRPGPRADVPRADPARTGALARALAADPGLVGGPGRRGTGAGPAHHRRMGRGVRTERSRGADLRTHRRVPPALGPDEQAHLKAAIQTPPRTEGIDLANWNWKVVREFVRQRWGLILSRGSCLNYLHRLGFVL